MIGDLIHVNESKWTYTNISQKDLSEHVPWVKKPWRPWPPHQFPWSVRDDITNVFLLSQGFKTSADFKDWFFNKKKAPINKSLKLVINYIYGDLEAEENQREAVLRFSLFREILERSLLWWNPAYSWPNEYFGILKTAHNQLLELNPKNSKGSLQDHPSFFGYELDRYPYTHIYSKLKQYSDDLIRHGESEYAEFDLFQQTQNALVRSIQLFFHNYVELSNYELDLKLDRIVEKEIAWCHLRSVRVPNCTK